MSKVKEYLEVVGARCKGVTPFDSKDNFCTRDQRFYVNAPADIEALLKMVNLLMLTVDMSAAVDKMLSPRTGLLQLSIGVKEKLEALVPKGR